jgi:hypothetical protein
VARGVEAVPARPKEACFVAAEVGDGGEEQASRCQDAGDFTQTGDRIGQMLQHVPHDDDIAGRGRDRGILQRSVMYIESVVGARIVDG